ncbi:DUF4951 domain-containing protein [Pseudomonas sp. 21LCFQ010]|uniref:DUF4951 domain-containing protein n=1 Tax=Pseudomonas sp. 21LCFQ010 TaxID=2957506 RepID=UPI003456CD92
MGHTFYVGDLKTWVHNTGPCDPAGRGEAGSGGARGSETSSDTPKGVTNPEISKLDRPSIPEGMTQSQFGKNVIGWGARPEGALQRLETINLWISYCLTARFRVFEGEFNRWFDQLTSSELDVLWQNKAARNTIEARIRQPGGLHEWCMVCRAPDFKKWGVPMDEIQSFRTKTSELK